jgi:hypothetical protein
MINSEGLEPVKKYNMKRVFKNFRFVMKGVWSSFINVEKFNPYNKGKRGGRDASLYVLLLPPLVRLVLEQLKVVFNFIFKSEVKEIPLKEMESAFDHMCDVYTFTGHNVKQLSEASRYDFHKLLEDLDKNGIAGFIVLWNKPKDRNTYKIKDGNHRIVALKLLKGAEHKVKVLIYNKTK